MDYKVILNLMKEMNNTDLTKLEIEDEGFKLTLEKSTPVVTVEQPVYTQPAYTQSFIQAAPVQPQVTVGQPMAAPATANAPVADSNEQPAEELSGKKLVSPMVGTFYSASAPDKPAFVKVGDIVKKGQTVCIIEAMKLMNEIESEFDGEIVKVLVNNEEMVEYGQPLFLIK